ncbi:cytochrome d ubiquinol oxidase subunit II [Thermoleophilia bacterium SCSIO 60948]|nr:cytochrome d ubiquinol oxidase subunit II [Thermoleophilia bacterium SCSIO 60948]
MLVDLCVAVLLLGIVLYAVLGGADFGAGFWDLTAGGAERGSRIRGMVKAAMGPVWEANHVWLIFVLVVFWTAFPIAFGATMQTLYIPLFLAAVGIIFRGTAFAVRGQAATISEARLIGAAFALASVLIPFFLGATIGGVASGRVPVGEPGDPFTSWANPTGILAGVLAVVVGAYVAAVFLSGDSVRAGERDLADSFRRRALGAASVAGVISVGGLFVIRSDAPELYDGLTSGGGLAMVIASVVVGAITLGLLVTRHFEIARYTSGVTVATVLIGMALAMRPDFLPGQLTLADAAAGDPTLIATLIVTAVAVVILAPSLFILYRLVLQGRLDRDFKPLLAAERHEEAGS